MNTHLDELINRWREGQLSDEELRRLTDALATLEGRAALRGDWFLEAALPEALRTFPVLKLVEEVAPMQRNESRRWTRWLSWRPLATAAAVVVLASVALRQGMGPQVTVGRGVGQQFAALALPDGELIGHGAELTAGLVELRFRKADASVVIEAPAKFSIVDAKTLRVDRGRISAHVRDGKEGLRVITPETEVLDLGTRFAVDVRAGGRSEVHVFDGKVAAGGVRKELVMRDQALSFSANAMAESRELRAGAFVQPEEMQPLARALAAGRVGQWRNSRSALERDPALLAWLDFVPKVSEPATDHRLEVHGARAVQGRFPGASALEFVEHEDHARLNLHGRVRQLTLMTWVRLDAVTEKRGGLFMVDPAAGDGAVRWLVKPHGRMRFWLVGLPSAESPEVRQWAKSSVSVFGDLGVWRHLAVTYDADLRQVRFYVDGVLDSEVLTTAGADAVLAPALVGSATKGTPSSDQPQQGLRGRMDELVILKRALSPAEIHTQFAAGNPYF